ADIIVVRRLTAQDAANADDGIESATGGQLFRRQWNFERSRDGHNFNLFPQGAGVVECVERAADKSVRDEAVESADHDGKAQSRGVELPLPCAWFGIDRG